MLKPLHNWLVVSVEEESVTKSGIILAGSKPTGIVKVLAVAKDIEDIKVGDEILVNKYSPLEVTVNGQKVTIIDYSDVYGVMEP